MNHSCRAPVFMMTALIFLQLATTCAAAEPAHASALPATEVLLTVERISKTTPLPQYVCTATIKRTDSGEILSAPRIQVNQGQEGAMSTATDSGLKVALKVAVASDRKLTYELKLTSAGSSTTHRATIELPQ